MANPNNADVLIVDRNPDGRGRGQIGNRVALVAQAVPGDTVQIKVDKQTKNTVQGRIKRLVNASPDRVRSHCPHEFVCTGCVLLGTSEQDELAYKKSRVSAYLKNSSTAGPLESDLHVERAGDGLGYRYFAKQVFSMQKGRPVLGAYVAATHEVADNNGCPVLAPCLNAAIDVVIDEVSSRKMRLHWKDEKGLRYLTVRGSRASEKTLITFVSSRALVDEWLAELTEVAESVLSRVQGAAGVVAIENDDSGNVILKGEPTLLAGEEFIEETICGFNHEIGAQSFFQINPQTAALMFDRALAFAGEGDVCLELFSGVGAMTLPLTKQFKKVIAVEINQESTQALERSRSQVPEATLEVLTGDAYELGPDLVAQDGVKVVVADPPRRGLGAELVKAIAASQAERLVLLSCQPSVLEHDLPLLEAAGFKLEELSVIDQFPGTVHVEAVALLVRS
ncbi:MAG: 23S rRNA (uracil(1939)-C(5))-methyltransferase RlmD [Deltaproteobacteria bacterium]|jgi:23S rRNA (uracil1939-C5)-methyltransferase|nr:23S rRNA (uracil(1939)-C(5))-methyltransferase RlmD [Deltaproteobacteria bacterium]MBT6435127.1 23S rRNA (uracil(1939)-C(5))-methyltransferase RlmD [Deltaproteobacteria bacterium]MBT6491031.1 23S rRNA (uracil(1939)-C(5))-methyltransferase RlmD [Deltaproteobacteria bacterium]